MRRKLFQIGNFYMRFDLTVLDRFNVLAGFNYIEGVYLACTDQSMTDCQEFSYGEFQIGLLFFTLAFGVEESKDYE